MQRFHGNLVCLVLFVLFEMGNAYIIVEIWSYKIFSIQLMIRLFTSVGRNFSKLVEAPKKYKLSPKAASVPIEIYER